MSKDATLPYLTAILILNGNKSAFKEGLHIETGPKVDWKVLLGKHNHSLNRYQLFVNIYYILFIYIY